jgi:cytochrome c-type biogenesis protein CcmH
MNKNYLIALGIFLGVGIVLFALLAFFVAPNASSSPQPASSNLDAETLRVAKGLYCPVCPGVPLDVCDTQACEQWRGVIKQKLSEGQNETQIEAYFVEQYGERVLGAPRAQGLNLLVYALPAFVLGAGAAVLFLFAQRRTQQTLPSPVTSLQSPASTVYRSRIERELKEND